MGRKPDLTTIANESTYVEFFDNNALYGSFVTKHYLSDDPYGDLDPIPWLDRYLNVPDLALGRLVESCRRHRSGHRELHRVRRSPRPDHCRRPHGRIRLLDRRLGRG